MKSLNKIQLIGHLGIDPEVKSLENGKIARFTLATDDSYRDKQGNKVEQTDWHNIVAWRGLAEIIEKYTKKGSKIYVEGKSKSRSWEDKEGQKRYTTEVIAESFILLDKKESED
ncbi:MAG: single-stranded DNA-binding protein [Ignavibacteria bacterium]|nr:single-stranded DNA-binding protein [Ignavibacteria bacterium]